MDFVTVSPKLQVVIPRVIRQALGLRPRQIISQLHLFHSMPSRR